MKLWKQGNLNELLHKAVTIQRSLKLISWSCDIGEASTKILHIKGIFMDWQKVILHIICQEFDGSIHVSFMHNKIPWRSKQKHPKGKRTLETVLLADTSKKIQSNLKPYLLKLFRKQVLIQRQDQYNRVWMLMSGEKLYQKVLVSHLAIFVQH